MGPGALASHLRRVWPNGSNCFERPVRAALAHHSMIRCRNSGAWTSPQRGTMSTEADQLHHNPSADRLLAFQARYERTAQPFQWRFTRADLAAVLAKLKAEELAHVA